VLHWKKNNHFLQLSLPDDLEYLIEGHITEEVIRDIALWITNQWNVWSIRFFDDNVAYEQDLQFE